MLIDDMVGYLACGLVFLTFYQKNMLSLRATALISNVAFIVYATRMNLMPIVLLHSLLLPMNVARLLPLLWERSRTVLQRE